MVSIWEIIEFLRFKPKNFYPPVFEDNGKKNKIAVAVSGGVDSSVALVMLQKKGYDVVGIYFKTYKPDGDRAHCKKEGTDAGNICKQLRVPFVALDLQEEYKKYVFEYMIGQYKKGNTPNPDIYCNKYIKFGFFWKEAQKLGADFLATGHYARHLSKNGQHFLAKAQDQAKDQTYFLSQISQEVLAKSIFPIGDFQKKDIRKMAKKFGLFTADKKDSQGICFIQKEVDLKDFLQNYIQQRQGDILNTEGQVVGKHIGTVFYTIGQRHGFELDPKFKSPNQERLFVIKKDFEKNILTIGNRQDLQKAKTASRKDIKIKNLNWFDTKQDIEKLKNLTGRIRHRGELVKIKKITREYNDQLSIEFLQNQTAVASGQFLALYQDNICLGGGEITR